MGFSIIEQNLKSYLGKVIIKVVPSPNFDSTDMVSP